MKCIWSFLGAFEKFWKATVICHACPAVRLSAWSNSAPTDWVLMVFDIWGFLKNLSRKFQLIPVGQELCVLYMKTYIIFFIMSHCVLLRMRNISGRSFTENQIPHILCSIMFFQKFDLLWDNVENNVEKYGRGRWPQITIRYSSEKVWSACWITYSGIQMHMVTQMVGSVTLFNIWTWFTCNFSLAQ